MIVGLGMSDTGTPGGLRGFSLRLSGCGHEGDQRVPNGLLHRVSGRSIKCEVVNHGADTTSVQGSLCSPSIAPGWAFMGWDLDCGNL
jgi:hypothetical protein